MNINQFKSLPTLHSINVENKVCIVRVDFNVPLKNNIITDFNRIYAAQKTINYLISKQCKIILLSHLSRIKEANDITSGKKSLKPVAIALQKIYPNINVSFIEDCTSPNLKKIVDKMKPKDIILLENTRYKDFDLKNNKLVKLESKNDDNLAKFWASLGEVYINDAFATIHREHASNAGIAKHMKCKCIGFLVEEELENIVCFNKDSIKPIVSIVGGAKISDKIILLEKLFSISNQVIIGGGMAFTFLNSLGINVGKSLVEKEMLQTAKNLYKKYKNKIILPIDAACSLEFNNSTRKEFSIDEIPNDMMCLDVGNKTIEQYLKVLNLAKTVFWNGPTGVFEFDNFNKSTYLITKKIADITRNNNAYSLIGGGDTAAAVLKFSKKENFSWVSTGGGATLAIIQGDNLPGLFLK